MKIRISRPALGILPLCFLAATVLPFWSLSAQMNMSPGCMGPRGRGPGCEASLPTRIDPAEQAAFDAFNKEAVVDMKIALGEQFDQKYPHGRYQESVDTQLAFMYFNKSDTAKFYAAADRVLATNPKNVPVLELAGWVIARSYDLHDPAAAARLDRAETYEKRALSLIAAMKKARQVTQPEFENSQASLAWRAHSGLGTAYFRRKDFADSAAELQVAVKQEGSEPDPTDLYVLGIDLENLNRLSDAADDFAQCSVATGDMQQQCQQAYEQASHAAVESAEKKAYDAFNNAPTGDAQIQLGEKFDETYPQSEYEESVDSTLATLYEGKEDWPKFYATADTVLAKDRDNAPVLALVGWVIPRHYDSDDPNAAARLDQAERYEKHALDLVAAMQKPSNLTTQQFENAKIGITATAHSGLGATYFRRGDFADSARELQLAMPATADAFDYYMLGIDLHELNCDGESAEAFTKCGATAGYLQLQCNRDAEKMSQDAAQLTPVATKSVPPLSASAAADIPPSTGQRSQAAIRAETIVVPVRVVVRDNRGRAIANLKTDNFKLYQDGKLQEIANFTAMVSAATPASPSVAGSRSAASASANIGAESVPSKGAPATASRFIALFFDDVHLYFADMAQIRTAAEKYLSSLQPQDRVAIVTASGQGEAAFTSDRDKLHATIAKLMPHPFPGGSMAPAPLAKCPPAMTYTEANAIAEQGSDEVLAVAGGDFAKCDGIAAEDPAAAAEIGESHAHAAAEQVQVAGEEAVNAVFEALQTSIR
ncbi:MAG TPA: VWA domain-containing protein, partial [Candidatus Acidoferrales bacterium]|nr:VWA domain-containing protein [Candidatus Acidoferrales bacterium]